ncbi:hypothetical protein PIB30_086669 [Stylosanthes scabra]|uniref:Uncharacterized protein n=1 Tax=Stylosanthes scabra TaxID=79078 RepID=A0ABU6USK6_9FABA|nr:hypothetical protein [Stylosanthes scabra]
MKLVEPRLSIADEADHRIAQLTVDLKVLNLQKSKLSEKEKDAEIKRLKGREAKLILEVEKLQGLAIEEKVRADLAEALAGDLWEQCDGLVEDTKNAIFATEGALKA